MRNINKAALSVVAACVFLAGTGASAEPHGGIVLFKQDNFSGDSRALHEDIANLDWIHFDDRASSVEVRRGVWELCQDSFYRGRCITVDQDVAKLSHLHFDDTISSVRRIR